MGKELNIQFDNEVANDLLSPRELANNVGAMIHRIAEMIKEGQTAGYDSPMGCNWELK